MARALTITSVDTLPLDLATAKAHLRVAHNDDDASIADLIAAGVEELEQATGRAFSRLTATLSLSCLPEEIFIPRPPLVSVESITYLDTNGDLQTLAADQYRVVLVGSPAVIVPAVGVTWPTALESPGSVVVSFTAGNPDTFSPRIKNALLLWLDLNYHNNDSDPNTAARIERRIAHIVSNCALRSPGLESMTRTE